MKGFKPEIKQGQAIQDTNLLPSPRIIIEKGRITNSTLLPHFNKIEKTTLNFNEKN